MKKIILAVALLFSFGSLMHVSAQQQQQDQQPQKMTFYYYPSSNIYYDVASNEYVYYDESTQKWLNVKELPTTITLVKMPADTVYYNGQQVWKDNPEHLRKYKGKKDEAKKKD
jgi:hypothetical protein